MTDSPPDGSVGRSLLVRSLTDADYRLMVDAVTDYAIFMLDPSGIVLSWNAGAQQTKGYTADEIIGRHFSVFYPSELLERDWPAHELREAALRGKFEDEGWRVRKDGTRFWANIVLTKLGGLRASTGGFPRSRATCRSGAAPRRWGTRGGASPRSSRCSGTSCATRWRRSRTHWS